MVHFNWTQLIPQVGHEYMHVATAVAVTGLFFLIGVFGKLSLGKGEAAIRPTGSFSLRGFLELFTELVATLTNMVIGEKGLSFVPLFAATFFFIMINNLVGLLPGMTPTTDNLNSTVAFGVFSFIAYNVYGLKEHGLSYFKQFMGPLLWLAPFMVVIEVVSHLVRPISLGLRLQGNMMGDHTVLGIFTELVPYGIPVIFYFLGMFVCFMQAFVFTMLTMIYVSMAISHDH